MPDPLQATKKFNDILNMEINAIKNYQLSNILKRLSDIFVI